jgi:hypothetical protein
MSHLAEKLYELIQLLPLDDREGLLKKIRGGKEVARSKKIVDLPVFTGGKWLGGQLGRDEIYEDENEHALPR